MRLAERITVTIAGEAIELRPSLRYAMRLERQHGPETILQGLQEGSITIACDLVRDHYDHPLLANQVFEARDSLADPLLRYTFACFGLDPDKESDADKPADQEPMTFAAWHAWLYRVGTGWLGWSPQDTLNATPIEIVEAYHGRVDMLRSIFGGTEQSKSTIPLADKIKAAMASFGTKKVSRRGGTA